MGITNSTLTVMACIGWMAACFGAALDPAKSTDDSVCDLSPGTTDLLGRHTFISGDLPDGDQAVGYRRLAAKFISGACRDGQKLILHSRYADEMDARYLQNIAAELCIAGDVLRADVTTVEHFTNRDLLGFELRCRISKFAAFRAQLQLDEGKESTTSLIARLNAPVSKSSAIKAGADAPDRPKQDCGKLTLSAMTVGGGGCR